MENIIKKKNNAGEFYINIKNNKMVLRKDEILIREPDGIFKEFEEKKIPVKATIELTGKCNLNCYHCYAKELRKQRDLDTDKIKKIIDILHKQGVIFLEITGGEPLAREDFLEILRYVNEKQFIVSLFTNAMSITDEIIDELKLGNTTLISTSLLAPDEEKCDELTGIQGSFKKIISGIKRIRDSGINYRVSSCITNKNVHLYKKFEELKKEHRINLIYAVDVDPTYSGYDDISTYRIEDQQISELRRFIHHENITIKDLLPEYYCGAGKTKLAIDNEGNFMVCYKFREVIGNILNEDFEKLWNSNKITDILTYQFKRNSKCSTCKKTEYCFYCPGIMDMYGDRTDEMCRKANILFKIFNEK